MFKRYGSYIVFPIIALALWKFREPLAAELGGANLIWLAAAAMVALIYLPLNASVWGKILQLTGNRVHRWEAAKLWIRCEAARWLPGGIWGYASRVVSAKELGVNSLNSAVSLSLELAVTIAAWATLAVGGLAISGYLPVLIEACGPVLPYAAIAAALGLVSFLLLRKVIARRLPGLGALLKNPLRFTRPFLEYLFLNSFVALGPWLCFLCIHATPTPDLLQTIGATAASWITGFFAIFAPGGIGVREGVFALIFQPAGLAAEAAAAAIIWRALQTGAEMIWLVAVNVLPETDDVKQPFPAVAGNAITADKNS